MKNKAKAGCRTWAQKYVDMLSLSQKCQADMRTQGIEKCVKLQDS